MSLFSRMALAAIVAGMGLQGVMAAPVPAEIFADGMVLQREAVAKIWGTADPNEAITVKFRDQTATAQAGADGRWILSIPTGEAGGPFELTVTGSSTVSIRDVLVGEVWLASGQSNMNFKVMSATTGAQAVAASADSGLRFFNVETVTATTPQSKISGKWQVAGPLTTGPFSAVAYFFAKAVRDELKVPVGILSSSWGGTGVTSWISKDAFEPLSVSKAFYGRWKATQDQYPAKAEKYKQDLAAWETEKAASTQAGQPFSKKPPAEPAGGPGFRNEPHVLFNAMIHPLIPYTIQGVIWYQGEGNTPFAQEYEEAFKGLIGDWRQRWGQGDFPFFFVQLAGFIADDKRDWATLRQAQANTLSLPKTGMAVAFDKGERDDIHPKDKQPVGERLAAIALNQVYGRARPDAGPKLKSAKIEGATIVVEIDPIYGQVTAKEAGKLTGFAAAGADGKYVPAEAILEGTTVKVSSAAVPAPVSVRYLWENWAEASLFNSAGFPMPPFRYGDTTTK